MDIKDIKTAGSRARNGLAAGRRNKKHGRNTDFLRSYEPKKKEKKVDEIKLSTRQKIEAIGEICELGWGDKEVWDE